MSSTSFKKILVKGKMLSLQTNTNLIALFVIAAVGFLMHRGVNYIPKFDAKFISSIILLNFAIFGPQETIKKPEIINKLMKNKLFKAVSVISIGLITVGDVENAVFALIAFLSLIQLLRTKEERKKYPYIV
jgi:uncharacterized membrane protein